MTIDDLIQEWEARAAELIRMGSGFRSKCNAEHRASFIGKAAGLQMAAEALRQYQATNQRKANDFENA